MFKNKVVFILGAGASQEAKFPLGNELKLDLGSRLDIRFRHGYEQLSGDRLIEEALHLHVNSIGGRDINPFLDAGGAIHSAMLQALSIDNFLQAHSHDEKIVLCGKLGIARSILNAEQKSPLYENVFQHKSVNFKTLKDTWYTRFFQLLSANVPKNDIDGLFRNVSIISFNYDRSLEQYLVHVLVTYYLITQGQAEDVVRSLQIFHPYGTVGQLPWQVSNEGVPFGGTNSAREPLQVVKQLRTFTEQVENPEFQARLKASLVEAKGVIFLGFAFHKINMDILAIAVENATRAVYATACGISTPDCDVIESELRLSLCTNSLTVEIRSDLQCKDLFDQYWRTFSAM